MEIRYWLRDMRLSHGLSQEETAREVEISARYYQSLEAGQSFPSRQVRHKLSLLFGDSVIDFLAEEEKENLEAS